MNIPKINLNAIDSKETFLKLFRDHCATHHELEYDGTNPFEFINQSYRIETLLDSFANTINGYDNGSFDMVDLGEFYNSLYEFTQVKEIELTVAPRLTITNVTQIKDLELTITLSNGVSGTFDFGKVIPEKVRPALSEIKSVDDIFTIMHNHLYIYPYVSEPNILGCFKAFSAVELNDVLNEHQDSTLVIVTNYEDHTFSEAMKSGEWEFRRIFLGHKLNPNDFEGDIPNFTKYDYFKLYCRPPSLNHATDVKIEVLPDDSIPACDNEEPDLVILPRRLHLTNPDEFQPLPELEEIADFNSVDFKPLPSCGDDVTNDIDFRTRKLDLSQLYPTSEDFIPNPSVLTDETSYLLSSKANEEHLMESIQQLKEGKTKEHSPQSVTHFLSMAPIPLLKKRSFLNSKRNIIILEFNMLLEEVQSNFMENSSDVDENVLVAWFEYFSSLVQAINSAHNLKEVRLLCNNERGFHYEVCTKVGNCGLVKNPIYFTL